MYNSVKTFVIDESQTDQLACRGNEEGNNKVMKAAQRIQTRSDEFFSLKFPVCPLWDGAPQIWFQFAHILMKFASEASRPSTTQPLVSRSALKSDFEKQRFSKEILSHFPKIICEPTNGFLKTRRRLLGDGSSETWWWIPPTTQRDADTHPGFIFHRLLRTKSDSPATKMFSYSHQLVINLPPTVCFGCCCWRKGD